MENLLLQDLTSIDLFHKNKKSRAVKRSGLFILCLIFLFSLPPSSNGQASLSYTDHPAIELIRELQESTSYRFLYREALLSDLRLSLDPDGNNDIIDELENALSVHSLTLQKNESRNQIIILKSANKSFANNTFEISGQIVDAETGERLPFSTLTWMKGEQIQGMATGRAGTFHVEITNPDDALILTGSYVGYEEKEVKVNFSQSSPKNLDEITIRLQPQSVAGTEIVITGSKYSPQDSSLIGLIKIDRFSPLGEGNAIRALQTLPAVSHNPAMYEGLHVRGSSPDGFQVELDGITIFNQSHLFGLLDSFNADVIQNSGFYYDVAPARVNAPTGGQLALTTKTGSLNEVNTTMGLSNSSLKATLHGPAKEGKSSWLIAGRSSFMNTMNWFNNQELIQWGLDINRPNSHENQFSNLNSELVTPGSSDAFFYDLHGKYYMEGVNGSRTMASFYFGGDRIVQDATRQIRNYESTDRIEEKSVRTYNRWNNFAATVQHQRSFSGTVYSHTSLGISSYETLFSKDDFIYSRILETLNTREVTVFNYPFANQSTMNQVKLDQSFDIFTQNFIFTTGLTGYYHRGEYLEESFERQGFTSRTASLQLDFYVQSETTLFDHLNLQLGSRFHYYSNGNSLNGSPRAKIRLFPEQPLSFSAGYSRNYQFLHRISFNNVVSSQVWILSDDQQQASYADHYSAGIYLKPGRRFYLQIEGYQKYYNFLRLHEMNARSLTTSFSESPWFFQNEGFGRGVEILFRKQFPVFSLTQTYTFSSMELLNNTLNSGERFHAEWDKTHIASTNIEISLTPRFTLFASWIMTSGTPDRLLETDFTSEKRLSPYYRLDASVHYQIDAGSALIDLKFSAFNLLNRQNEWYREYRLALERGRRVPFFRPVEVEIYDLGFQPSFEAKVRF
ncbi:MAG: carboxypeptidase-like regulatory domain-containing protein [Balneolaceae bacterium]